MSEILTEYSVLRALNSTQISSLPDIDDLSNSREQKMVVVRLRRLQPSELTPEVSSSLSEDLLALEATDLTDNIIFIQRLSDTSDTSNKAINEALLHKTFILANVRATRIGNTHGVDLIWAIATTPDSLLRCYLRSARILIKKEYGAKMKATKAMYSVQDNIKTTIPTSRYFPAQRVPNKKSQFFRSLGTLRYTPNLNNTNNSNTNPVFPGSTYINSNSTNTQPNQGMVFGIQNQDNPEDKRLQQSNQGNTAFNNNSSNMFNNNTSGLGLGQVQGLGLGQGLGIGLGLAQNVGISLGQNVGLGLGQNVNIEHNINSLQNHGDVSTGLSFGQTSDQTVQNIHQQINIEQRQVQSASIEENETAPPVRDIPTTISILAQAQKERTPQEFMIGLKEVIENLPADQAEAVKKSIKMLLFCPSCGNILAIERSLVGMRFECSTCNYYDNVLGTYHAASVSGLNSDKTENGQKDGSINEENDETSADQP